jgi:DNA invertase Pin-like site-specific DNA recombinase
LVHAADIMERAVRQKWALVAVDMGVDLSTPTGEAFANTFASFARFERRLIGARISEAMAAKKARGEHVGRRSVIPPDVLDRICGEREDGATFDAIAKGLTEDDVLTPGGQAEWQSSTVRRAFNSAQRKAEAVA